MSRRGCRPNTGTQPARSLRLALPGTEPGGDVQLKGLVAAALPTLSGPAASGSMPVRHPSAVPGLTLHVHPVSARQMDFGAPDPRARSLVEGRTVPDIAVLSHRAQTAVRTHLRHIHRQLGISRLADLLHLVLSVLKRAEFVPRR